MTSSNFEDKTIYTDASRQNSNSEQEANEAQPEQSVIHYDHRPEKHHYSTQVTQPQVYEQKENSQTKKYHIHQPSDFQKSMQKRCDKYVIGTKTITLPRLNVDMLVAFSGYKDKIVTIVGKYKWTNNTNTRSLFIDANKDFFHVKHSSKHKGYDTKFIQITGYFLGGDAIYVIPVIQQQCFENWGDDFNLLMWNKLLLLIPKYPNLF